MLESKTDHKLFERSQNASLMEQLDQVYDAQTVHKIADTHGLTVIYTSLSDTLKNAGSLYLRYGRLNGKTAHDLAPKFRTVARAAEISNSLSIEIENLDFWDRWQIFQHLRNTGHPLTEHLDSHTTANPLLAGNLIVEEIQLVLRAITRFEADFFEALTNNTDGEIDLGLYFFVEVIGTFWQSLTGKKAAKKLPQHVLRRTHPNGISPEALAFLSDCIAPLATITEDELVAAIQSALL